MGVGRTGEAPFDGEVAPYSTLISGEVDEVSSLDSHGFPGRQVAGLIGAADRDPGIGKDEQFSPLEQEFEGGSVERVGE